MTKREIGLKRAWLRNGIAEIRKRGVLPYEKRERYSNEKEQGYERVAENPKKEGIAMVGDTPTKESKTE